MELKSKFLKIAFFSIFFLMMTAYSNAQIDTNLQKNQISVFSLQGLLKDKFLENVKIDTDGDLRIELHGVKIFVTTDNNRSILKFSTIWKKSENILDSNLYELLNTWNRDKVFTTAFSNGEFILLEYFLCTDGGINAENFNGTLEWLFPISYSFNDYLTEKKAID